MLITFGKFRVKHILHDFRLMALNKNEIHERNRDNPDYLHDDGWGIVLGESGKITEMYKKDVPCWKDSRFVRYYEINPDLIIAHARRATHKNLVDLSYTHPFEKEGWYFCHNGTVIEPHTKDNRDSELLLMLLLSHIKECNSVKEGIKNAIKQIKDFTALNFILANDKFAYVLVKYRESPLYYTMKYLKKKDYVIVSSEILPHFKGKWKIAENNMLLELDIANRNVNMIRL
jgi:predicted glutamine amidotransferase